MYFGSGIVSIIGPAFAYIPVITASLGKMMAEGQSFDHAWGRMAGTIMAVAPIQARTLQTKVGSALPLCCARVLYELNDPSDLCMPHRGSAT